MKVINLDSYRKEQGVILNGIQYKIKGITVGMFLGDLNMQTLMGEAKTSEEMKENVKTLVDMLCNMSDIPREVLIDQPFEVINALMVISQGGDPMKDLAEKEKEKEAGAEQKNA